MNNYLRRTNAAIAAGLVAVCTAGCSILPVHQAQLTLVRTLYFTHASVEAIAAKAPASAEPAYNKLREDYNSFIDQQEAYVVHVSTGNNLILRLNFEGTSLADTAVPNDVAAFAAAAPNAPSQVVLNNVINPEDVLVGIYGVVNTIQDDRKHQGAIVNQYLDQFKLAEWDAVKR